MGEGESSTSRMQYNRREQMDIWWWRRGRGQSNGCGAIRETLFRARVKTLTGWYANCLFAVSLLPIRFTGHPPTGRQLQLGFNWKYPLDSWSMNCQKEKWHHLFGQIGESATGDRLSIYCEMNLANGRRKGEDYVSPTEGSCERPVTYRWRRISNLYH